MGDNFYIKKANLYPYYSAGSTGEELGSIFVDSNDLSYGLVKNVFSIELADLEMSYIGWDGYGSIKLKLGYNNREERLFYSEDNGNTFREIWLKRGTIEKIGGVLKSVLIEISKQKAAKTE